ncbi:MAG: MATE family efflux transporter [Clostridia bacterium]|nr:MATE family efflux transporter [Clostridia bacterium]
MKNFIFTKQFLSRMLVISVPIILQNLINVAVSMLDTFMLMNVSQPELSASSLANQPTFLFSVFLFGLSAGGNVLAAQYNGKGDIKTIRKITGIAMQLALAVSVVFSFLSIVCPELLMKIYTNESRLITLGAEYLRIVGFGYVFMAVTNIYLNMLRSIENVKVSMFIYLASFFINGILNYIFIFGALGVPAMGIKGAAVATLIARISEFIMVLFYARYGEKVLRFKAKHIFVFNKYLYMDFIKYSVPVLVNEFMWAFGISSQQMVLGRMGDDAVAAANIVSVLCRLTTVVGFGIANATSIMVGKTIGEGELKRARQEANTLIAVSVGCGVMSFLLLILFGQFTGLITTLTPNAMWLLKQMLFVGAIYTFFQSFNATNIVGVLRSGGDVTFGLVTDITTLYATTALGAVLAFAFNWPPVAVYFMMSTDEFLKMPLGLWRLASGKWIRNITRDSEITD